MRRFLGALALCLATLEAAATPFSTDVTDLWWNPNESGWGVNLVQQGNVLFATFFVYGSDSRPRWFVASEMTSPGAPSDQPYHFTGALYETTGPAFSGAFDPNAVTRRPAGTVTFEFVPPNSGIITYTVDGVVTSKSIRRQTWRVQDLSGEYRGHRMLRPFQGGGSCPGTSPVTQSVPMNVVITQSGATTVIRQSDSAPGCTYTGTYTQQGRLGALEGTYACADGTAGAFLMSDIEISRYGYVGRIVIHRVPGCNYYGHMGGMRTETPGASE